MSPRLVPEDDSAGDVMDSLMVGEVSKNTPIQVRRVIHVSRGMAYGHLYVL